MAVEQILNTNSNNVISHAVHFPNWCMMAPSHTLFAFCFIFKYFAWLHLQSSRRTTSLANRARGQWRGGKLSQTKHKPYFLNAFLLTW